MKINARNSENFRKHIELICFLAGNIDFFEGIKLFKKLHYYEKKYGNYNEQECNYDIPEETTEKRDKKLNQVVKELLPGLKTFFLNGDPRGYALKFSEAEVKELREKNFSVYTDMGGYGILSPEY